MFQITKLKTNNVITMYNKDNIVMNTQYNNNDYRAIYDTNIDLLHSYDLKETVSIFKDYKNELNYEGEVVLLEKIKSYENILFRSDIDILFSSTDDNIRKLLLSNKYESTSYLIPFIKELHRKSIYYDSLININHDNYSHGVYKLLIKIKKKYRLIKKKKLSKTEIYNELSNQIDNLKKLELSKKKLKSSDIISFFREFTNTQIIYNVIKDTNGDHLSMLYYVEKWKVMFIPQHHYTVASYDDNKLNNSIMFISDKSIVSNYNNKYKKLISYNTPFITHRYIRKHYDGYEEDLVETQDLID